MEKKAVFVLAAVLGVCFCLSSAAADLQVTPAEDFNSAGPPDGPFTPPSEDYQLTNVGPNSIWWGVYKTAAWLYVDPAWGPLGPGASTTVTVGLTSEANSLPEGVYTDTVTFLDITNEQEQTRGASLSVVRPGVLEVSPAQNFEPAGPPGGPFTPPSKQYQLTNSGGSPIDWSVTKIADWLDLDSQSGSLDPCESTTVTVSLNAAAQALPEGVYTDTLTFTDVTNGGQQTRGVTLSIESGLWVTPGSFDLDMIEGCRLTEILTIGNSGDEDLVFALRSREISREIWGGVSAQSAGPAAVEVTGENMVLQYEFSEPLVSKSAEYDLVQIHGFQSYERTGAPIVPVRPVTVLVPFGKEVVSTRVILLDTRKLPGTYLLAPGQEPHPLSYDGVLERTEPDPAIYGQEAPWPGIDHEQVATQSKRGYQLLTLNLFPLQYMPVSGELTYATNLRLEIDLADSLAASVLKPSQGTTSTLSKMVDNPNVLGTYPAKGGSVQKLEGAAALPGGGPYQYLIITNGSLESAPGPWNFQALRDAKIARGMTATIVTTDWIYANYDGTRPDGGSDNQTRIRNFLIDAYQSWGTEYVLLGGTNAIVPARMFWVSTNTGGTDTTTMPVDMYYSCVDPVECSFDHDADGKYGEPTDGAGGVDVDLYAEIYVGRATVENATELENFIRKTLTYSSTYSEYLPRISMLGEYLGFGGPSEYAKDSMEQIRLGGTYDGYFTYGFENHTHVDFVDFSTVDCLADDPACCWPLYDKEGDWPKSKLLNLMNGGIHVFNHLGHANYTYCMKLNNPDLASLTNTDYFFAYSQGCMPGGFDTANCFAEVLTSMQYGAFAAVMNARYGWGRFNSTDGPSQRFARQFWDAALDEDMLEMGRANQDSKEDNLWDINGECIRWCYYELNLFGDPQQQLRFEEAAKWISFEPQEGTIGPGDTNDIRVTFEAIENGIEMTPGTYEAQIVVLSNDPTDPTKIVPVIMIVTPDDLQVAPKEGFGSNGTEGGPFEPQCTAYTLTNIGVEPVAWTTWDTEDWLAVTPNEGILGPAEMMDVNVCMSPDANLLDPNLYAQTLIFQNTDSNSIKPRLITLAVKPPDCFTESFAEGGADLDGLMLTFMPDGTIAYYEACRDRVTEFPADPNGGTYVGLWDDDSVEVVLSNGAEILFYGQWYDRFYIGSNGYITFGQGDTQYTASLENHFNMPRISGLFADLTPPHDQCISYKHLENRVVVTYEDVPLFGDKEGRNSFQIEVFFVDGTISITWLNTAAAASVAGLSKGRGIPPVFFEESNLSKYPPCWPWGDFNRDYSVNWLDLAVFVLHWLQADCSIPYWCDKTDLDFSSTVQATDYSIFADNWMVEFDWWLQPVAHWKFDEGQGDIAYDSAGMNHGTIYGATWTAGQIDGALSFDGEDDYVQVSDHPSLSGMDALTLMAWVKTPGGGRAGVINKYNAQNSTEWDDSYNLRIDDAGSPLFQYRIGSTYVIKITEPAVTDNSWHHIAGVYTGSDGLMYIDGNEVALSRDDPDPGGPVNPSDHEDLLVGCINLLGSLAQFFNGGIDDARVYDRALSAEEIEQIFLEGLGCRAFNPHPANGAFGVDPNVVLSWSPGPCALSHDIYFGTDFNDVQDANTTDPNVFMGNQDTNSWDPCDLETATNYYWRIDEVGASDTHKGNVWSFMTFDPNDPNRAAWWRFDEGQGTVAYDSAGTNNGIVYGALWTAGRIGPYALDFDGDDYVQVDDDPSLDGMNALTLSAWIKTPSGDTAAVINKYNAQNDTELDDSYNLRIYGGSVLLQYRIGSTYVIKISAPTVTDDSWHHISGLYTGSQGKIYIDGDEVPLSRSDPDPGGAVNESDEDLYLGCIRLEGQRAQFFDGKIDDVRIYNRALTAEEIEQLYQQ